MVLIHNCTTYVAIVPAFLATLGFLAWVSMLIIPISLREYSQSWRDSVHMKNVC
jgi:hypothetical protein